MPSHLVDQHGNVSVLCQMCMRPLATELNDICLFCETQLILESEERRRAPLVEPKPSWPEWVLARLAEAAW